MAAPAHRVAFWGPNASEGGLAYDRPSPSGNSRILTVPFSQRFYNMEKSQWDEDYSRTWGRTMSPGEEDEPLPLALLERRRRFRRKVKPFGDVLAPRHTTDQIRGNEAGREPQTSLMGGKGTWQGHPEFMPPMPGRSQLSRAFDPTDREVSQPWAHSARINTREPFMSWRSWVQEQSSAGRPMHFFGLRPTMASRGGRGERTAFWSTLEEDARLRGHSLVETLDELLLTSADAVRGEAFLDVIHSLDARARLMGVSGLYVVGGALRDLLGERLPGHDIDVTAHGYSGLQLAGLLASELSAPIRVHHNGVVTLTFQRGAEVVEVDFRNPLVGMQGVVGDLAAIGIDLSNWIEADVYTRDFTVNTLIANIHTLRIFDMTGCALKDIGEKRLRTILPAERVLEQSPYIAFRAVKMMVEHGYSPNQDLVAASHGVKADKLAEDDWAHLRKLIPSLRERDEILTRRALTFMGLDWVLTAPEAAS